MQAILYVKTVYAYANETIVKYAYANALQSTLQYGVQISLVQVSYLQSDQSTINKRPLNTHA